jgi:hypothetical protein
LNISNILNKTLLLKKRERKREKEEKRGNKEEKKRNKETKERRRPGRQAAESRSLFSH